MDMFRLVDHGTVSEFLGSDPSEVDINYFR